jgi:hypothetical protein
MTLRTFVMGDWGPVVRDPIDVLRLSLAVGAIGFGIAGEGRGALILAVATVVAWLVRPVALPRLYDLAIVLAISLQGWGEALELYDTVTWFDNVVHFAVPLLGAPVVYIVCARLDVVPDPKDETHLKHYAGMFLVTLALGLAIGAIWEMIEYASDELLGSELQLSNADTVGDLMADGLGALCGAALLICWARFGWGSVRRIPGDNRAEAVDD